MNTKLLIVDPKENKLRYDLKDQGNLLLALIIRRAGELDIEVNLFNEKIFSQIAIFIQPENNSRISINTRQNHHAGDSVSTVNFYSVLATKANVSIRGLVHIFPHARNSDAYFSAGNLIINKNAFVECKPELEIENNNVKCSHGVATGPVDPLHLWQLLARGISLKEAESLIINGFYKNGINRINDEEIRKQIAQILDQGYNQEDYGK